MPTLLHFCRTMLCIDINSGAAARDQGQRRFCAKLKRNKQADIGYGKICTQQENPDMKRL